MFKRTVKRVVAKRAQAQSPRKRFHTARVNAPRSRSERHAVLSGYLYTALTANRSTIPIARLLWYKESIAGN